MNLRLKIALTLAVLAAPSFAVLSWFRHDLERRFEKERRDERIADFLAERVPRGCVEHPETWRGRRGRRPGPRAPMFAYNA